MLIEASAMEVRQKFGELVNQVQYRNATVEITKSSKPVAALINIDLFEKIMLMRKEFDRLTLALQSSLKNEKSKDVENLISEAVKHSRRKK
jgi:prevent-host-death family protein